MNIINEKNLSIKEAKNYAIEVLNQTLANVMLSFNLLELYNFKDILENIVMLGLKDVQEKIEGGGEKYGSI